MRLSRNKTDRKAASTGESVPGAATKKTLNQPANWKGGNGINAPIAEPTPVENPLSPMNPDNELGESRTSGPGAVIFIKASRYTMVVGEKRPPTWIPGPIAKPQIESLRFFALVRHHDIYDMMTKPLEFRHVLFGRGRFNGAFWLTDPRIEVDRERPTFDIPIGPRANDIEMNKSRRRRSN